MPRARYLMKLPRLTQAGSTEVPAGAPRDFYALGKHALQVLSLLAFPIFCRTLTPNHSVCGHPILHSRVTVDRYDCGSRPRFVYHAIASLESRRLPPVNPRRSYHTPPVAVGTAETNARSVVAIAYICWASLTKAVAVIMISTEVPSLVRRSVR